jgi:chromate reductase
MRVLGISGSLRRDSLNSALLRTAAKRLPAGAELVEFDRLREVPPYDEDVEAEATPAVVEELREAVRSADAVLIATPEYNHSIPGQLKNALDWVSRPAGRSALNGKPAAVVGVSTGMFGAVWAQAELRKVLGALGGRVVEAELPVARAKELFVDGHLELSPQQSEQLEEILAELVAQAELEAELAVAASRGRASPPETRIDTASRVQSGVGSKVSSGDTRPL